MIPALILTLDNTLIKTRSKQQYALHSEDWLFNNQAVAAIKEYSAKQYKILIISNQLAIYNNITPEKSFLRKMELIVSTLERDLKLKPASICYSYCIDVDSYNFLPNPGMLYDFALDFDISLYNSILIGSSIYDKTIATYSGISTYLDISLLTYKEE